MGMSPGTKRRAPPPDAAAVHNPRGAGGTVRGGGSRAVSGAPRVVLRRARVVGALAGQ
eukprot:gene46254-562_t